MNDDDRLDNLNINEPATEYNSAVKIDRIKLTNYKFFYGVFELAINGKDLLIYGENGTGKSSIYKALELLTQNDFSDLDKNLNIFSKEDNVEIEFGFTNGQELILTSDLEELPDHVNFINGLSIFKPMLDYKKLLKVHYSVDTNGDSINLYGMFRELFNDYPVEQKQGKITLSEIDDLPEYFRLLEGILENDFQKNINEYLNNYFHADFSIEKFEYKTKIDKHTDVATPVINIILDYKGNIIEKYHTFLNEARLSALAISIYMVAIKKLLDVLENDSLKMLVLDDLLISLDMSNRLKLLEILKNEFINFQIFFFTHDKELYEIYKNKMDWNKYEIYLDDSGVIPKAILKQGKSEIERAKMFYAQKEFDACALLLRKGFEKKLKAYLTPQEQRNENCEELNLAGFIDRAISKSSGKYEAILKKLNSDRQHILNPLCYIDTKSIHSEEIKSAMEDLEKLEELLK